MSTCPECGLSFLDEKALCSHKKTVHKRICSRCKKEFPTGKALHAHNAAEHPQWCTICGKSFASQQTLHDHLKAKHLPQRNNISSPVQPSTSAVQITPQPQYKCDKCNVTLGSLERLEQHKREVHNEVKHSHCTRLFKNAAVRDAHEATKHPRHRCDSCESAFFTLEILEEHKRNTHFPNCHYCNDQFPTDALRYQHELAHHPIHNRKSRHQAYVRTGLFSCQNSVQHQSSGSSSAPDDLTSTSSFKPPHVLSQSDLPSGAVVWKVGPRADSESSLSEDILCARRGPPAVPGIAKDALQAGAMDDHHIEYKCGRCNVALRSQERLEQHQQRVHTEVKCDKCNVTLRAKKLAQHIQNVHTVVIKCSHCTRSFKATESLNQHEAAKHSPLYQYDRVFPSAKLLATLFKDIPEAGTVDVRPIEYKCDKCNVALRSQGRLERHQQRVHTEVNGDKCNVTLRAKKLAQHIQNVHTVTIKCSHCTRTFKAIESLNQHEAAKHPPFPQYDSVFPSAKLLAALSKDTPEAGAVDVRHIEYKCDKCNVALRSPERLERHHQKVHTEAKCNKCNVVLCSSKRLARRLRKVHGITTKGNHSSCSTFKRIESLNQHGAKKCFPTYRECDECDSVFPSAELLAAHNQDAHLSFKCEYCEDTFQSLEERNQHQPGHHCDSCDRAFYTLEALVDHKRDRHNLYCRYCIQYFDDIVLRDQHEYLMHKCNLCHSAHPNSEALQRHKDANHSHNPLVASMNQIPMGHPQASIDHELSENIQPTMTHARPVCRGSSVVDDRHIEYKCDKCNVTLRSQERLERHQQKVHIEVKCNHCTKTFKCIESLNQHRAAKHSPLYYQCDRCSDIFPSAELLAAHNRDISFKCDHCEDTFQSLEERDQHQTGHLAHHYDWAYYTLETLERYKRDRNDLYCHYCRQYFTNIVLRDQHEYLTHKCSLCHGRYRNSKALQRHKDASHSLGGYGN